METHRGIQMSTDQHTASRHTEAEGLLGNLETAAFKSHRVVVVDDAFVLLGEDLVQILARITRNAVPLCSAFTLKLASWIAIQSCRRNSLAASIVVI